MSDAIGVHETVVRGMFPANPSGIHPTEFKVLVLPKPVEEVTKGGIIRPDMTRDHEKFTQVEGTVVAKSPLAFTYARPDEWQAAGAEPPRPGDRVLYARHAGSWVKGEDGKEYVLLNDKDILATLKE